MILPGRAARKDTLCRFSHPDSAHSALPSVPEFHRVGRLRTLLHSRFADCHRRWGIAPRPEALYTQYITKFVLDKRPFFDYSNKSNDNDYCF